MNNNRNEINDPNRQFIGRPSIRLPEYDYSQEGGYFVTICTQHKIHLFGEIISGEMKLSKGGQIIEKWWHKLPHHFPSVNVDQYVIMSNHFHGILFIVGVDRCVDPLRLMAKGGHAGPPLPRIVQWFKTMTTNDYIKGVKASGLKQFHRRLWQRNYYEYIIRGDEDLYKIRKYIIENPMAWEIDPENPARFDSL